jgi:hypothetical protein
MFWIHFIGTLEVHKNLADADFWPLFQKAARGRLLTTCCRSCFFGVQINSSALETFTKVLSARSIKLCYRETWLLSVVPSVTQVVTISYMICLLIKRHSLSALPSTPPTCRVTSLSAAAFGWRLRLWLSTDFADLDFRLG